MQTNVNRRDFLKHLSLAAASLAVPGCSKISNTFAQKSASQRPPNFIIIFCDDLGYGDLGCFGSKKHRTPHIDRMAKEGTRFTSFYVTSGVCTPSRSSLMTGCYPRRVNMHQNTLNQSVLFPVGKKGLHPNEMTIAEVLKKKNYATACIGKWHLGDQPKFLPTRQGFDFYYGIPYSNDMGSNQRKTNPPLPLLRNETVIEAPVDQNTITMRYTHEAINFIKTNKDHPFLVYLPHTMPHNPVHSSDNFRGKSANKGYGDTVEEIDFSTGQILQTLKNLGIDRHTLVVFTSDNGAAKRWGGSNLPLSGWKGSTMEGGMRIPCIMRWPGKIPAAKTCNQLSCTMDLMPTFAKLAGTSAPKDRIIDGKDIWPLMAGVKNATSPHEVFYYYMKTQLQAVRSGKWKLHLPLKSKLVNWRNLETDLPMKLYDLEADIAETTNLADKHPDITKRLFAFAKKARNDIGDHDLQGKNQRPAGMVVSPKPLLLAPAK